jgi:small nuclear ribonucleoprotein (snRNP)-like protein
VIYILVQLYIQSFKAKYNIVGNAKYMAWFSKNKYYRSIINGFLKHLNLVVLNSIKFIIKAYKNMFKIASTTIIILLKGSWSKAKKGGTLIKNLFI